MSGGLVLPAWSQGAPARTGPSRQLSRWFLVGMALLTVTYTTDPSSTRGSVTYVAISLSASLAVIVALLRYRPTVRSPWCLMAILPVLGCIGMVLRQSMTPTSILVAVVPDLVTIPGYLLLLGAMIRLVRARRGTAPGGALDGGLMAVGGLLVSWSVVITPVFHADGMPMAFKVVNVAYPTISVAILFVAALLAMNESTSIPAFWCLAGAWSSLIVGDVVYAMASIGSTTVPLWVGNTGYCAFYALLGAAALDPSMVDLSRPTTKRVRPYGLSRFMAVAVALVLPAIVVSVHASNTTGERLIDGAFLAVLGSLVFARMARAVNRHAQSEQRLERLANHDILTGMANRLQLETHLAGVLDQAREARTGVGVIFLDLDNFKNVNDNWGHQTGDELLKVVASRVESSLRPGELAARVGGDEFIVVCAGLRTSADAAKIADRVLHVLDDAVHLSSCEITVSASAGLAFARPSVFDVTASDLLREADTAMYRSKGDGRHAPMLFDESMRTEVAERVELESALRGALERGELELHYQPIVDLRTGDPRGFEALMRWHHPVLGTVAPDRFIPIAEDTGLILKLGRWAIVEATTQLRAWRATFGLDLSVSVNLSAHQMHDPELVPTVRAALAGAGIPPAALCLEITERTVMDDLESTLETLAELKHLGIWLAADDFGTGYSSLAYLRQFPFDEVKIDRSFVQGLDDETGSGVIVGAVASMAHALSLTAVAEGVETERQRARLLALGAEHGQGWLFSRPLPGDTVVDYLRLCQQAAPLSA